MSRPPPSTSVPPAVPLPVPAAGWRWDDAKAAASAFSAAAEPLHVPADLRVLLVRVLARPDAHGPLAAAAVVRRVAPQAAEVAHRAPRVPLVAAAAAVHERVPVVVQLLARERAGLVAIAGGRVLRVLVQRQQLAQRVPVKIPQRVHRVFAHVQHRVVERPATARALVVVAHRVVVYDARRHHRADLFGRQQRRRAGRRRRRRRAECGQRCVRGRRGAFGLAVRRAFTRQLLLCSHITKCINTQRTNGGGRKLVAVTHL
ncbi:hypothetical protein PybrP1_011071 [[Pythium] brassicae (nom. inval.)]|nr:hypothetical protein PybrP1_011071 [[Pythium] brassicae (nom. inval.)]